MDRRTAPLLILPAILAVTGPALGQDLTSDRPTSSFHFLQYGVGVVAVGAAAPGDICPPEATSPCILGSGLGVALRGGYRSRGAWYAGGLYQVTRHDSSNILRLAILQQVLAEGRYYVDRGTRLTPFVLSGLGAAAYGNEWGAETGGPTAQLGLGVEVQVSARSLVEASLTWQPLLLRGWTDSTNQRRADRYLGFGLAQIVSLELTVELRSPLPRF